jgi:hypothetical protein
MRRTTQRLWPVTSIQVLLLVVIVILLLFQQPKVVTSTSRGRDHGVNIFDLGLGNIIEEERHEDREDEGEKEDFYADKFDDYDDEEDGEGGKEVFSDDAYCDDGSVEGVMGVVDDHHETSKTDYTAEESDDAPTEHVTTTRNNKTLPSCGVYYAESTIPGAGFGYVACILVLLSSTSEAAKCTYGSF